MNANELKSPNSMPLVVDPDYMAQLRAYYCRMELLHAVNRDIDHASITEAISMVNADAFAHWMLNQDNAWISEHVLTRVYCTNMLETTDTIEKYFKDVQEYYSERYSTSLSSE